MLKESTNPNLLGMLKLLAKRAAGTASDEDIVAWAVSSLEQGADSSTLRVLAGLEMSGELSEVRFYFQRILNEIGWTLTDPETLMLLYAKQLATDILRDVMSPIEGIQELYELYIGLGLPYDLTAWSCLADGHDSYSGDDLTGKALEEAIKEEAIRFLKGEKREEMIKKKSKVNVVLHLHR